MFFLIWLVKRAKLLAHDWCSGCLAKVVTRKKFSVTTASRCEIVDKEYIEKLRDKSENENMKKKNIEYWKNVFKK